jgi:predicted transcriptional regulator
MCTLDERVIEFVDESILANPSVIASKIRFNVSERRVQERCEMLAEAGLIAPVHEGGDYYVITTSGQQYLDGDLDVKHRPRPRPTG